MKDLKDLTKWVNDKGIDNISLSDVIKFALSNESISIDKVNAICEVIEKIAEYKAIF